jgi:hypothetical protein
MSTLTLPESGPLIASAAGARDFVRESNRQGAVRFIPSLEAL